MNHEACYTPAFHYLCVFNVEITNQSLQDAQLLITDITGREIKRCPLNNQLNNVSIEHAANGMYIWQVLSQDKLVQTGKLVKQQTY